MSKLENIHKFEKAICWILNFDGWNLKWSGSKFEHYDAKGFTPKGYPCVIEMKFRNDYYEDKLLEKYKYDKLMKMDKDIVKLYFVNDPKGNYIFWLNKLELTKAKDFWCPETSFWGSKKVKKKCYLLNENQAVIKNLNK
ncbi:MAG: hypothetical protein Unbinned3528contig1000_10 [Prokaryotic dsDNA virus sp.]|nr:MAG: hypothetical protein Unbinned3528contig1000_10 [Prokaryotic dsDNA virus sp.]